MSIRRKVIASILAGIVFVIWKCVEFYEYVAIFYSPKELAAKNEPWGDLLKQILFRSWVGYMALALLIIVILAIWLSEPIAKSFQRKTAIEKLLRRCGIEDLSYAEFGEGPASERDKWKDRTPNGELLLDRVKFLLRQYPPVVVNPANLQLPDEFLCGTPKNLRLWFSDGSIISLNEGQKLSLAAASLVWKSEHGKSVPEYKSRVIKIRSCGPWTSPRMVDARQG